jgi:hypothetical protein
MEGNNNMLENSIRTIGYSKKYKKTLKIFGNHKNSNYICKHKLNGIKMGLINESSGGGSWLTINAGEITRRVPAGTEGAVSRTIKKTGKLVHELRYNALEGTLKRINVSSSEYGEQWVFVIDDGREEYNLAMPYSSGTANGFLFRLPNLNLEAPLKVKSYYIEGEDGKWRQFIGIEQAGEKVLPYFTKEEKHGLPDLKEVTISKKKHLDDTDRLEFLRRMVDEKVNPKLAELYPIDHVEETIPEDAPGDIEDVNDLPFAILALLAIGTIGFSAVSSIPF